MSKDLDRVIEYAQKRINQAYDDLNNQRGNILTLNQSIKDQDALIKFCNQLKSEQPKPKDGKIRKIVTDHHVLPIPINHFNWSANREWWDEGEPIGYGVTEWDAIEDLLIKEKEQ